MRRSLHVGIFFFAFCLAASAGCGGCSDDAGGGAGSNNGGGPTADAADGSGSPGDGGDVASDAAPSDAEGGGDAGGGDGCNIYQSLCNGQCIPTNTDPDNCGGCGVTCAADEVCSGGACVASDRCMSGLTPCDRQCVDTDTDSDNCGGCGNVCRDGEGCVQGSCEPTVDLGDGGDRCANGGPPIDIGGAVDDSRSCSGNLAELTFRWALCSCEDVSLNNELIADAYDSTLGPYVPGGEGGGIGTNGTLDANNRVDVSGTLWVAGDQGLALGNDTAIGQRLYVGGLLDANSATTVGEDAFIEGELLVGGSLDIGGTLHVPAGTAVGQNITYGALQEQPVDVAPPCTECSADARIPVGDIVASHAANNDNALIGLDSALLDNPAVDEKRRIDLPCGQYYLDAVDLNSETTIVAHGNTALYIGGDVTPGNTLTITLAPDAQLDVFIAGDVVASNRLNFGSPNYPALMRVYIGGPNGLQVNNRFRAAANIYAVPGGIANNNRIEVFGAVYAQNLVSNNDAQFHFDRRVTTVGDSCPDPDPGPDPDPTGDAGFDTGDGVDAGADDVGGGDAGGGGDPVCGTEDEGCGSDSDCCSPLFCIEGTCKLLSCVPLTGPCEANADCCSGFCGGGICIDG